eukprot:1156094-Pelagomonas_calceolata.AAC.3
MESMPFGTVEQAEQPNYLAEGLANLENKLSSDWSGSRHLFSLQLSRPCRQRQGYPPASPPLLGAAPCTAAPSTAAPSLLAAPHILHQSSPHHAVSASQACASKYKARCHGSSSSSSSSEKEALAASGRGASGRAVMTSEDW